MTLGDLLKKLRGTRTQLDVSGKLGISRARYSHYENDHVQPDHELLQRMADHFDVSVDYLLGREPRVGSSEDKLTEEEMLLIESIRNLTEKEKQYVVGLVELLDKK